MTEQPARRRPIEPPAHAVAPVRHVDEQGQVIEACDDEIRVTDRPKIVILGGGPNRIGQGIELDYC